MIDNFDAYMKQTMKCVDKAYKNQDLYLYLIILQAYWWPLVFIFTYPIEQGDLFAIPVFILALIHIFPAFYGLTRFFRSVNEAFNNNRQTKIREYNK